MIVGRKTENTSHRSQSKAMNIEKLLKLCDFLDTLPPEKFNYDKCGTVCCAVGWLPKLFPDDWEWLKYNADGVAYKNYNNPEYRTPALQAALFFDIPDDDARKLFVSAYHHIDDADFAEDVTPEQLSQFIREYIDDTVTM
jgi:hypothetical protein